MKSSLEAVDLIYGALVPGALKTAITGDIYKQARPLNSEKEDVVINALPVTNQKIQRGLVNVNIHVPNLSIPSGNVIDKTLPNTARIKALAAIAIGILKEKWGANGDYLLEIESERIFPDGSNHYSNIRVLFYSLQN